MSDGLRVGDATAGDFLRVAHTIGMIIATGGAMLVLFLGFTFVFGWLESEQYHAAAFAAGAFFVGVGFIVIAEVLDWLFDRFGVESAPPMGEDEEVPADA